MLLNLEVSCSLEAFRTDGITHSLTLFLALGLGFAILNINDNRADEVPVTILWPGQILAPENGCLHYCMSEILS
jgi:hypothetical protein